MTLSEGNPPERLVMQTFATIDPDGIPQGSSVEVLCDFRADTKCPLQFDYSNSHLSADLRASTADLRGFATVQLTWVSAADEGTAKDTWATWIGMIGE
ncbi:hypothetical protein GCM10009818_22960 [Nakamurella flavida]